MTGDAETEIALLKRSVETLEAALRDEAAARRKLADAVDQHDRKLVRAEIWGRTALYSAAGVLAVISDFAGIRDFIRRLFLP